jgi:hypothetical protein
MERSAVAAQAALAASMGMPIDRNHATDLFADRLARLEQDGAGDSSDALDATNLRDFNARDEGGTDSERLAHALQSRLDNWIGQLPVDQANQLALVSVQCRVGQCQVLIANSGVEFAYGARANAPDLSAGLTLLVQTPWWQKAGIGLVGSSMVAADRNAPEGSHYALWTFYLSVASAG